MEPIDLSLIDIGGADDSILEQLIEDECNGNSNNHSDLLQQDLDTGAVHFACSPLQFLRSKRSSDPTLVPAIEVSRSNCEMSSSVEEVDNKENRNAKNLSAEISNQEVKRRKKGGGYNLRKSLAWNSAFFTEEGVLDPLELSRLSNRPIRESGSESLSGIPEEISAPQPKGADIRADGSASASKLFHESHTRSSKEGWQVGRALSGKARSPAQKNAASVPSVSQKALIAKSNIRSVSHGGGCPRPSGSSSQIRPLSSNVRSAPVRNSKLPKFPVSKSESSSVSTTSKNAVPGVKRSSCNLNMPSVNAQKNIGLKGTTRTKVVPGCISSSAKSSGHFSGKFMQENPSSVAHVSTGAKLPKAGKCNSVGTKVNLNPLRPNDEDALCVDSGSDKVVEPLRLNTNYRGGNVQNAQFQPAKPSGLRMPSPSLGYFDQRKASASPIIHSPRNIQPYNLGECNNPTLQKLNNPNYISETKRAMTDTVRLAREGTDSTKSRTVASGSTLKCPLPSSAMNTLHLSTKSNLELNNLPVEVKSDSNPSCSFDQTLSQRSFQRTHDKFVEQGGKQTEPTHDKFVEQGGKQTKVRNPTNDEFDHISHEENSCLQMNCDNLLEQSGSSVQAYRENYCESIVDVCRQGINSNGNELEIYPAEHQVNFEMLAKCVARADYLVKNQHGKDAQIDSSSINNHDVISGQDSEEIISVKDTLVNDDCLEVDHCVNGQLPQADIIKPSPHDVDKIQHERKVIHDLSWVNSAMHGSRADYMIECQHGEGIQTGFSISDSLVNNKEAVSDTLLMDSINYIGPDALISDSKSFTLVCDTDRQSEQQTALENHPGEIEEVLFEDNYEEKNKSILVKNSRPVENSFSNSDLGNLTASPEDREASGRMMQHSGVLPFTSSTMQVKEGGSGDCSMMDTQLEALQVKFLDGNVLVESHLDEQLRDAISNPHVYLRVTDDVEEQVGKQPEPRKTCSDEVERTLSEHNAGLQMHGNTSVKKSRSSEESHNDNVHAVSSERQGSSGAGIDPTVLQPHREDMCLGSLSSNLSIGNQESIHGGLSESSSRLRDHQIATDLTMCSSASVCSLKNKLGLLDKKMSDRTKPQVEEDNGSEDNIPSKDTGSGLTLSCKNSYELHSEAENNAFSMDDNSLKMIHKRKSLDDLKPEAPAMKLKLNAVPFSDEWLAALEAVGEDILTVKTGAVQNSPPEKSLPETNPWSPVKRKNNQEIGPFDCTKYTNLSQPHLQ